MKLSLAPISYFWTKEQILAFYDEIAETPVDIIYLGETICSKRRSLNYQDWINLAKKLRDKGKEVVLSTMTLLEAESDLKTLQRLCSEQGFEQGFMIEANDFAAIDQLAEAGKPFVTGPSINIYNSHSLSFLAKQGLKRWTLSVELSKDVLKLLQAERPEGVETEVFVWGRIPLAYSARCFTARAHNLPKDNCQYRCINDPDGLLLKTREDEAFLCINGIQTQSALSCNLLDEIPSLRALDVDVLRISPQSHFTPQIIEAFHQRLQENLTITNNDPSLTEKAEKWANSGSCNGYWHGGSGMDKISEHLQAQQN